MDMAPLVNLLLFIEYCMQNTVFGLHEESSPINNVSLNNLNVCFHWMPKKTCSTRSKIGTLFFGNHQSWPALKTPPQAFKLLEALKYFYSGLKIKY